MAWDTEFPDFTDMPEIPEGFEDASWRNDICPCCACDALRLLVYIDYPNPKEREYGAACKRFFLFRTDETGAIDAEKPVLESDSWTDVLGAIETARAAQ